MSDTVKFYIVGSIAALLIGLCVGLDYGVQIGVAVGYALLLLVDIRKEVSK